MSEGSSIIFPGLPITPTNLATAFRQKADSSQLDALIAPSVGPKGDPGPAGPVGPVGPSGLGVLETWDTLRVYSPGPIPSYVSYLGSSYVCYAQHTSSTFDVDFAKGYWGVVASVGAPGATGQIGPAGAVGPAGPQGTQGPQGLTGNTGPVGPTGPTPSTAQIQTAVQPLIGAASGIAPLDAGVAVPLANLQVRTAQLLNSIQTNLPGGWSGFANYAQNAGTLGVDPSSPLWIAIYIEAFALPSGTLASAVSNYLTASTASGGLGMTPSAAASQMTSLFTAAAQVGN